MKKLKKVKNKILKMSITSKIVCSVLILALVVGAVAYGVSSMEAKGENPEKLDDKTYLSDIVDRITEGKQKYFTILEVVPYAGMGEFKYFVGSDEVSQGILSKPKSELQRFYNEQSGAYGKKNEWVKVSSYFSNFGYEIKYNSYQDKYELRCTKTFYNDVLIEPYRSLLEGRVRVNTVEANDLTEADIEAADLIVLTATIQDNSTVEAYNYYSGNVTASGTAADTTGVYKKNGDAYDEIKVNNSTSITYDTYEKVGDQYVSRDISWDMAKKLLDYMEKGRDLLGTGKYSQTPVIFSATLTEGGIPKSSNMYKLSMIYRMLETTQYDDFMTNHMTTVDASGNQFLTSAGIPTAALCYESEEVVTTVPPETTTPVETTPVETTPVEETSEGETTSANVDEPETTPEITTAPLPSKTMKFVNEFTHEDILKAVDGSQCIDTNPNASKRVTNDYWVHNNDARMVTTNLSKAVTEDQYKGLTERGLNNKTVADIVRYLLGCKNTYTPKYNYGKVNVLEVEPSNSFKYSGYEGAKKLAAKMNIKTDGWNASNYKNYMEVTCVSTRTLNTITTDLISTYDVILISDDTGMLNKDSAGVTRYNDRNLDGYIYLAYGDLTKLSSTLMGWMPWEYAKYTGGYGSGNKLSKTSDGAYMEKLDDYPSTTRYSSYNWASTRFVRSSANTNLSNQVRYNQLFALNANTKRMWTDYQWETLNTLFNSGDLLGVIDTTYYYKDYKKLANSSVDMMADVFSDKVGNARFSDNDITAKTMKALQDYADAGKLLVFADCVYDNDGSKIYPTSHLSQLMNSVTAPGSDANYLRESNIAGFITHINAMSPKLTFTAVPTPVTYVRNGNGDQVIKLPSDYNRTLTYAFSIDGYANTEYKVKLIIDKDGNGIYADTGKIVTDDTNEIYKTIMVSTDANGHADVKFSAKLADNQNGLVAYKVEVAQMKGTNESTLRSSYIGYTAVRAMDIEDVKVLQIIPHSQYTGNNSKLTLDMAYTLNGMGTPVANNAVFEKKLTAVNDGTVGYNITVRTMYTYEFENKFSKADPYIRGVDYGTAKDYINANFYDMVVLGFGDMYRGDDISNMYGALDCIRDFMDNGNAVMFAHDTMSFNSSSNYVEVRNDFTKNANGTYSGSTMSSINRNSDRIFMNGGNASTNHIDNDKMCTSLTLFLRNSTGMDRYGVTLSTTDRDGKGKPVYAKDKQLGYTTASSDGNYYVEELQGFSDWVLLRQGLIGEYKTTNSSKGWYLVKPYNDPNNILTRGTNCWWATNSIERVNEGQVTMFPYRMGESVGIATTHSQYYQLDMEDEDLVVWYTLKSGNGYYNYSRKDGQNNYYIYSKGNVTYTGAGHENINGSDELKLFINTIIKAIDSGNAKPEVIVTNGALGSGIYNIYASVGDNYSVRFKAVDQDLATIDTADGDLSKVGVFESGRVIWDRNKNGVYDDGVDIVMETYSRNGNKLYNDIINKIEIASCPALASYQTEITNQIIAEGAYFLIEATDMYGEIGSARAKLTTRDLFALD